MTSDTQATMKSSSSSAYDPRLVVVSEEPFNAEAPLAEHTDVLTPTALFYARNHFSIPALDTTSWRLQIGGEVEHPLTMSYDELCALPAVTLTVTLECAGNGRSGLQPQADGEPWQYAAVSTAAWTGVPLYTLLELAGIKPDVCEMRFLGADSGHVAAAARHLAYERSLPLAQAFHPDVLLAYRMNGAPLPARHGFPLRLIVPGWYGMAAVKWLTTITASSEPFTGFYQSDRYIMTHPERGAADKTPLTRIGVRSLIISPAAGAALATGEHLVRGLAWSGAALVERVEMSSDGGVQWEAVELLDAPAPYAWRRWQYRWQPRGAGTVKLCSRAFDAAGNAQPTEPEWNRLGYCNNAIQHIAVSIG